MIKSKIIDGSLLLQKIHKIGIETDRDNANVGNNFSAKLLRIASEANKWHILNVILTPKMAKAHLSGDYYIHDLDSYNLTINCLHVPTGKLLSSGFNTGYGMTLPPKRITTAASLSCIILQSSQNDMFGGQSHPNFDNDLAPYVEMTRQELSKVYKSKKVLDKAVIKEVHQAMQSVVYNLNTMHSRAGSQVPFSSINIGIPQTSDAALVCEALLDEYEKGMGLGEPPIFPNIIFRVKVGVNREPADPYYYLFQKACQVASVRMNPTFMNIDADFNKTWYDKGILPATMGCRTYILDNINGKPGCEGRGNIAPVTINLPRLAILASQKYEKSVKRTNYFFKLFDKMIENCRLQLLHRYNTLKNLKVSDLPFVAGQGLLQGSEWLSQNSSIEPILKQGSWGIGFIGLAECLKVLVDEHHGESEASWSLGVDIISHLRSRCDEFKSNDKLNFSCYATPAEGLSGKFIKLDKEKFGIIPGITDKGFYTNSFHIPVNFPISIAEKIKREAPFHRLCNGGHISYIEFDDNPTSAIVEKIIRAAYSTTNISYLGINFHIRYCLDCACSASKAIAIIK